MNYAHLFADAASCYGEQIAIVDGSFTCTHAEIDRGACAFAHALQERGIAPQRHIALLSGNSDAYVKVLIGCLKANVVPDLINTRLSAEEVVRIIGRNSVDMFVFDEGHRACAQLLAEKLGNAAPRFVSIPLAHEPGAVGVADGTDALCGVGAALPGEETLAALMAGKPDTFAIVEGKDDDLAVQAYTSGTTGHPKAMPHTHKSLVLFNAMYGYTSKHVCDRPLPARETFLCLLPIYHVSGITALYALATGGTVVFQSGFAMQAFLEAVQTYRITRTTVPQTVVSWLVDYPELGNYDLSSLIELAYGGAPISAQTVRKVTQRFSCALTQAYGSTEVLIATILTGADHLMSPDAGDMRAFSLGKPMIGVEVKVADAEGRAVEPGVRGEICVKSPAGMAGHENQWVAMGDMGYMDERGYLYLASRKDDMIISGGENIYPKEVENCIRELGESVADAAVVGAPDAKWGQTPIAFVVRKPGVRLTQRDVISYCERRIARYKRPSRVVFLDALPQDNLGKVSRVALRALL